MRDMGYRDQRERAGQLRATRESSPARPPACALIHPLLESMAAAKARGKIQDDTQPCHDGSSLPCRISPSCCQFPRPYLWQLPMSSLRSARVREAAAELREAGEVRVRAKRRVRGWRVRGEARSSGPRRGGMGGMAWKGGIS